MGKKLLVSMALEGKFCDSALQDMDDGEDVLTALARELVMKQGIGESADAVWKLLQAQQPVHRPAEEVAPDPQQSEMLLATLAETAPQARRTTAAVAGEQLSLF
jgi:hypothetical protein